MRALFDAIINDDPLPEEKNADNTPVPGTPESTERRRVDQTPSPTPRPDCRAGRRGHHQPAGHHRAVSNSTGEDGLAATAASELQTHGFNVTTPDDYPGPLTSTTVFFSPGNEQAAATVASSFANPTIERVDGHGRCGAGRARLRLLLGGAPVAERLARAGARPPRHQQRTPTHLPEDLTVTNAADTTCE